MRSQVQVLAGPPPIVAGHSTAGSEPGAFAAGLGRAGAARPSPLAPPVAPPGPPPGRPARRRPPTVVAHPAEDGRHAACGHLALQPAPVPKAQPPARALRAPAWPAWSLGGQARPSRPAPNPVARVRQPPSTDQRDVGSVARVPASATVDRAVDGPAATGPHPSRWSRSPASSTWSPPPPPEWEETDASGPTGQTPDGWTPHGRTADGWTPDSWAAAVRPPDTLDDQPR
jgi:eukaryotic-like serine/threonine-protein kinase